MKSAFLGCLGWSVLGSAMDMTISSNKGGGMQNNATFRVPGMPGGPSGRVPGIPGEAKGGLQLPNLCCDSSRTTAEPTGIDV